ncbi:predicted protein [Uncinocarpus reesii 1704]|uniref:Uncharacterized protein n=1 Tax=Uncinocarpus reesii (strain UAMH 1704) TaxID=336963 RepID=C4JVS2_UNCRE|nr:uncharacterized protein UREG_06664 [Uncinocarpus reesii 1704]EEP81799.1 predicted protein [Uncinocarpus reesii 1704]
MREEPVLVAVEGPTIKVFQAQTGLQVSSWPIPADADPKLSPDVKDRSSPPEKRRRLSPPAEETEEAKSGKSTAGRPETGSAGRAWSTIPILTVSPSGDHVIVVTGEDKCLRVLELKPDGTLTQLSERFMPKRPCALAVTPDNTTILCGDKFGDVYSLPILPREEVTLPLRKGAEASKPFQPSASKLTVHTQKNLRALEQQLRNPRAAQEKSEPSFEHTLLLGHVSMLSDMILTPPSTDATAGPRQYLITSDRDEHIRVSRSLPQTHVIHGYCLGHTSFVSKLCIPSWIPKILISGGGDDFLFCWDWLEGRLLHKVPLGLGSNNPNSEENSPQPSDTGRITVSGICAVPFAGGLSAHTPGAILVALEGVSKLLTFSVSMDGILTPSNAIELSGNALDVTAADDSGKVYVSVDNIHKQGSTKELRDSAMGSKLVQCFTATNHGALAWEEADDPITDAINNRDTLGSHCQPKY